MGPEDYPVSAHSYLGRARQRLDEGRLEGIFYAAFELRCGIVQRMREYLDAQQHVSEKEKQGWRIPDLGRTIEEAFRLGNRIGKFTFRDRQHRAPSVVFYYTPVSPGLRSMAGQLGGYLHAPLEYKHSDDPVWDEMRDFPPAATQNPPLVATPNSPT